MDQQINTSLNKNTTQQRNRRQASFYLQPEHWSPRYDPSFFTIELKSRQTLTSPPPEATRSHSLHPELRRIETKRSHPACYYVVKILYGHTEQIVLRRYAQFRWLYDKVTHFPPHQYSNHGVDHVEAYNDSSTMEGKKLTFPPRRIWPWSWWPRDEALEKERQNELCTFLTDMLSRPGYASHPSLIAFLELKSLNVHNGNNNVSNEDALVNLGNSGNTFNDVPIHVMQSVMRSPAVSRSDDSGIKRNNGGSTHGRQQYLSLNGSPYVVQSKILMVSTSEGALLDLE